MKAAKDLEIAQICLTTDAQILTAIHACRGNGGSEVSHSRYIEQAILRHIVTSIGSAEFPNFYIALRTLLTIPVTVASGERSFSKLKLIKT